MVNGLRAAFGIFLFAVFSLVSYVLFGEAAFFFNKYFSRPLYAPHKVAIYTSFGDEALGVLMGVLAHERKISEHSLIDTCEKVDECGNVLIIVEDWVQLEHFHVLPGFEENFKELFSTPKPLNYFSFNVDVDYGSLANSSYIRSKNFYIYSTGASRLGGEVANCIIKNFVSDIYRERGAVAARLKAVDIINCEGYKLGGLVEDEACVYRANVGEA